MSFPISIIVIFALLVQGKSIPANSFAPAWLADEKARILARVPLRSRLRPAMACPGPA
jgi:hypothetical protein